MNPPKKPINVLIVDDNNLMRSILGTLLRHEGYNIVGELANAASVMPTVTKLTPDIVCLDQNLPDGDGLDILVQLHKAFPTMPIVMITGAISPEVRQKAADGGAAGFLTKPFSQDQIIREFQQITHARQLLGTCLSSTKTVAGTNTLRVVIADDSSTMRLLLSTILESIGLEVVGAANDGQQAIDLAQSLKPDLVCLDVEMPKLNGLAALSAIKTELPTTRVVMVTSHAESGTVKQALVSGASGYILKPYQAEQIATALRKFMTCESPEKL
jgi:two-component system, response regulator PdtaR